MKNKILLSTILSISLLSFVNASENLDEITVTTATKTEKNIDGVTASVIVITKEDIEKTGASTLDGVLKKIPSLSMQYARFPHPSSVSKAAISIRGSGANGTLFLIDGKRLSAETENPYLMTRIPISMIEKIEIVKGSMSTLYGSDAISGVINIITKDINKVQNNLDIKYGANKNNKAKEKNISISSIGKLKKLKYKFYTSILDTKPYEENKTYKQTAINPKKSQIISKNPQNGIKGRIPVTYFDDSKIVTLGTNLQNDINDNLSISTDINYFKEERKGKYIGVAAFNGGGLIKGTPIKSNDINRRIDLSFNIKYLINENIQTSLRTYRSYYKKRNKTTPINFKGPVNTKFSANVTIDTIESLTNLALDDLNLITFGAEYRKEKRDSSAINPIPSSSDFITKIINYKSLYAQDEVQITDKLNATLGARYDNISNAEDKITFKIGLTQKIFENTNIRANFAQGYRTPDIAELYVMSPSYKDGKRFGSEVISGPKTKAYNLKPEQSETYELAISNRTSKTYTQLVLFTSKIKDKIELVSYGKASSKYYTSENLSKVDIRGFEANFDYNITPNFNLDLNLTYLDTKDRNKNKKLTFTPNLSSSLALNYKILPNLNTNLIWRYISEQYINTDNTNKVKAFSLLDTGFSYNLNKTFTLYSGIDNILDKKTPESIGINKGRFYYGGLRINF